MIKHAGWGWRVWLEPTVLNRNMQRWSRNFPTVLLVATVMALGTGGERRGTCKEKTNYQRKGGGNEVNENWDQNQDGGEVDEECDGSGRSSIGVRSHNHMLCMCCTAACESPISPNLQTAVLIASEAPLLLLHWLTCRNSRIIGPQSLSLSHTPYAAAGGSKDVDIVLVRKNMEHGGAYVQYWTDSL